MARTMVWLLPETAVATCLAGIAAKLRTRLEVLGPPFEAHLTLVSGACGLPVNEQVRRLREDPPEALALPTGGDPLAPGPTAPTFDVWMSLYLPHRRTPALDALADEVAARLELDDVGASRRRTPHISLAYTGASRVDTMAAVRDVAPELAGLRAQLGSEAAMRFPRLQTVSYVRRAEVAAHMDSWQRGPVVTLA